MTRKGVVPVGLLVGTSLAALAATHSWGEAAEIRPVAYACEEGARVTARFFDPYRAVLRRSGRAWGLRNTMAASGSRYEGSGIVFWLKGDEAMLEQPGGRSTNCHVVR